MANSEWKRNRSLLFATRHSPLPRRLRREGRAAHAHAPARILPQLLRRMQMPERARDSLEVVRGKPLGDVGVVERLGRDRVENLLRQRGDLVLAAAFPGLVRFAREKLVDPRAIRIGIGDALVTFARHAFGARSEEHTAELPTR